MKFSRAIQRLVDQADAELVRSRARRTPQRRLKVWTLSPEEKVHYVMREFKRGVLRSGAGHIVTSREQAIAIALAEAGLARRRRRY